MIRTLAYGSYFCKYCENWYTAYEYCK